MPNYPTVPGRRIGTDQDGTIGVTGNAGWPTSGGIITEISGAIMDVMYKEDLSGVGAGISNSGGNWVGYFFPELRDFDGWFASLDDGGGWGNALSVSSDTTNMSDGSWAQTGAGGIPLSGGPPIYREEIITISSNGKRGVRVKPSSATGGGGQVDIFHMYGEISAGETPDRLLFIDESTSLEFVLAHDYEELPRGSADEDVEFRLLNNSTVAGNNLTINTIAITAESFYLTSGDWYTFSLNGDSFASTKNITSLSPEALSQLFVVRRVVDTSEVMDVHSARIKATVVSLT